MNSEFAGKKKFFTVLKYKVMASVMLVFASSKESPSDMHPGKAGTVTV